MASAWLTNDASQGADRRAPVTGRTRSRAAAEAEPAQPVAAGRGRSKWAGAHEGCRPPSARRLAKRAPRSVMVRTPASAPRLRAAARGPSRAPRVEPGPGSSETPGASRSSSRKPAGRRRAQPLAPSGRDVAPGAGRAVPFANTGGPIGDGRTHAPDTRHRRCLHRPRGAALRRPRPVASASPSAFTPSVPSPRQPRARVRGTRPGDWRQLHDGAPRNGRSRADRIADRTGAAGLRRVESSSWPTRC